MSSSRRLVVDPIACDGHGLCAELFPEWVTLDDWGFPWIEQAPIPASLEPQAQRAVSLCPKLALRLAVEPAAGDQQRRVILPEPTS